MVLGKRSISVEYDDETVSDDLSIVSLMFQNVVSHLFAFPLFHSKLPLA